MMVPSRSLCARAWRTAARIADLRDLRAPSWRVLDTGLERGTAICSPSIVTRPSGAKRPRAPRGGPRGRTGGGGTARAMRRTSASSGSSSLGRRRVAALPAAAMMASKSAVVTIGGNANSMVFIVGYGGATSNFRRIMVSHQLQRSAESEVIGDVSSKVYEAPHAPQNHTWLPILGC